MSLILTQIGNFVGTKVKDARLFASSEALAARDAALSTLRGAVPSTGDTLEKLYQLLSGNRTVHSVDDIAGRDALTNVLVSDQVFVEDDGDGRWAIYMVVNATTPLTSASFVKVSDPDLLNEALSAGQIKALYESNIDTNAFTDAEKAYLAALLAGLETLTTTNKTSYAAAINEVNALALANQSAITAEVTRATNAEAALDTRLTAVEASTTNMGTFADFETAFNAVV